MSEDAQIRRENLASLRLGPNDLVAKAGRTYSFWRDLLKTQKSFGEKLARQIESDLALPRGWLDHPHSSRSTEYALTAQEPQAVAPPPIGAALPVVLRALASLPALQLGKACAEIERLADHPDAVGEACSRISDLLATAARRKRSAA